MILRTTFPDGFQQNIEMNGVYQFVSKDSEGRFSDIAKGEFKDAPKMIEDVIGFVLYRPMSGKLTVEPLYKGFENLIMCNDGTVFENLSQK